MVRKKFAIQAWKCISQTYRESWRKYGLSELSHFVPKWMGHYTSLSGIDYSSRTDAVLGETELAAKSILKVLRVGSQL